MAEKNIFPYKFNSYDPAIFVEIYLPKKIRYQGVLYKSLRTGFNFEEVKKHLIDPEEFTNISEFLEDYKGLYERYQRGNPREIEDQVSKMEEAFYGFSMYEVNGVFFNKKRWLNMRSRELREQEIEQRSQQRFPSSSHVVNKLKKASIQWQVVL